MPSRWGERDRTPTSDRHLKGRARPGLFHLRLTYASYVPGASQKNPTSKEEHKMGNRLTKIGAGLAALAALALGGAALASGGSPSTPPPAAAQPGGTAADTETNDTGQKADTETAGDQSPAYSSSIKVPEQNGVSDQAEAATLAAKATVTPAQAKDAALAAAPGTAGKVELDSENGNLVYSVEVTKAGGTTVDVKVDAGNAKVLAQEAGEGAESGSEGSTDDGPGGHADETGGESAAN